MDSHWAAGVTACSVVFPISSSQGISRVYSTESEVTTIFVDPAPLYRSDDGSPGSFVLVPDGSAIMSPVNRANPDVTDAAGHFGWDVITGYYVVRAEAPDCFAPGDPLQLFVESPALTIPPPVTLRLSFSR